MDKTEYRMRLDEINRLVDAQDYEGALEVADSIEWKRVKSVRTLCMVADIYEVNGELEESMRMLQLAYKRSSVGKMILYRQVELSLKMGRYDDAVKYYNQYLETAANDTSKYILKYKIYKAQDAPLEEQIAILEEYKDREYTERWVYELARLYKKAGKQNKCVSTCDDLILWFGEGKYVTKAMELKMTYVPLTPDQKAKYDQRNKVKENRKPEPKAGESSATVTASTVAGISAAAMESLQKASIISARTESGPRKNTDKPVRTVGMEEAAAAVEPSPEKTGEKLSGEEEKPVPEEIPVHVDTVQLQEKLAKSFQEVLAGFNRTKVVNAFEALGRATGSEMPTESAEEENIEEYQVADLEPETANETKISAERGEAIAHRTEMPEIAEPETVKEIKPEDKEVTSIKDMDLEALFAETSSVFAEAAGDRQAELANEEISFEMPQEEERKESEAESERIAEPTEQVSGDGTVPAETVEEETADAAEPVVSADTESEENVSEKTVSEEECVQEPLPLDADAEAAMAAFEASLLSGLDDISGFAESEKAVQDETAPEEIAFAEAEEAKPVEAEAEEAEPVEAETEEAESVEADSVQAEPVEAEAASEEVVIEEVIEAEIVTEEPVETEMEESFGTDEAGEESIDAEDIGTIELDIEEPLESLETETADDAFRNMFESAEESAEEMEDDVKIAPPIGGHYENDLEEQLLRALGDQPKEESSSEEELLDQMQILVGGQDHEESRKETEDLPENESFIPDLDLNIVMELQKEKEDPGRKEAVSDTFGQEPSEDAEEAEVNEVDQMIAEAETDVQISSAVRERETPEEKRQRILNNTRPEKLTDEQKRLFSYFSRIPGMDEQILEAIDGVYQHVDEKTSRRGNIAIMGSHGTGKTRLSEGLVKAICKELGLEAVKYANLDASDMNRKDPAAIIGKMAGGFLLIERASFMNSETIEKLSQAMDFRTDSMILIIEDDKANMRKMLADYPEFAKKFHTVISIPVFTNDELVTFARTYAKENGYRMDEMGVLALYTLIGDNQREDEPITIGKVKEMVDRAIRRAGGARLGRRISKRHTDEDGRILLYEKDFDL